MVLVEFGKSIIDITVDGNTKIFEDSIRNDKNYSVSTSYTTEILVNGSLEYTNDTHNHNTVQYDADISPSFTRESSTSITHSENSAKEGSGRALTLVSLSSDSVEQWEIDWSVTISSSDSLDVDIYYGNTLVGSTDDVDGTVTLSGVDTFSSGGSDFYVYQDAGFGSDTANYSADVTVHADEDVTPSFTVSSVNVSSI